jgi:hypothetical protein
MVHLEATWVPQVHPEPPVTMPTAPAARTTPPLGQAATAAGRAARSRFSVHPSVEMVATAIAGLKDKTGRSLDEWVAHIEKRGPRDEKARALWLKESQGLGTNYARWLCDISLGKSTETGDPAAYLHQADVYVDEQYSGAKAPLRPIFDRLLSLGLELGADVRACPCKTMVPLYRHHVFAEIKPTTRTRVDLGLALKDTATPPRLINTGGFEKRDRITRRIAVCSVDEIDKEVVRWMRAAYAADG